MAGSARDEVINYVYNVTGDADLAKASGTLLELAKSTSEVAPEAQKLLDELNALNTKAKDISGYLSTKAALADVGTQLTAAISEYDNLVASQDRINASTGKVNSAFTKSEAAIASLTAKQNALSVQFQYASGALAKAGVDTDHLSAASSTLAEASALTTSKIAGVVEAGKASALSMKGAAAGAEEAAEASTLSGKAFEFLHDHLLEIVSVAAAAELALKGIEFVGDTFSEGLKAAEAVQQSLARVKAVAQGTADQFKELPEVVEKAAIEVNVSTETAGAGIAALTSRGLDLGKAFEALTPTLLLAKDANIEVADAATTVATTLQAFNLPASEAQKVVDILATASHGAAGGLQAISKAAATLAPDAQKLGLSLTQTVAILEALNQKGIDSEKAVRALRGVFQELQQPSSELRVSLKGLGDNTDDFATAVTALTGKTPAAQQALLQLTGESRAVVEALGQAGPEALQKFQDALDQSGGKAKSLSQILDDTTNGAFTKFSNALHKVGEDAAKPVLKPLQDELELLAAKLLTLSESDQFKKIQDDIGAFATTAFNALNKLLTGIDFESFGKNIESALSGAVSKANDLANSAATIASAINKVSDAVGAAYHGAASNLDALAGGAALAAAAVEKDVGAVVGTLGVVSDSAGEAGKAISALGDNSLASAKANFSAAGEQAKAFVDDIIDIAGTAPKTAAAVQDLAAKAGTAGTNIEKAGENAGEAAEHLDDLAKFSVAGALAGQRLGEQILDTGKDFGTASDSFTVAGQKLDDLKKKSDAAADSLKTALTQQLLNLGLSAEQAGVQITAEGQKIITSFQSIATNGKASANTIQLAFAQALSKAQTEGEVQALESLLRDAFNTGKIGADQFSVAIQAAGRKTADIEVAAASSSAALDGMAKAGQTAAQTISTSLQATRDKLIVQANDIAAALAAAIKAGADPATISNLKAQYAVVDAQLAGLNTRIAALAPTYDQAGNAGAAAGHQMASGFQEAIAAEQKFSDALAVLGDTSASTADKVKAASTAVATASTETEKNTAAVEQGSVAFAKWADDAGKTASSLGEVSEQYARVLAAAEQANDAQLLTVTSGRLAQGYQEQKTQLDSLVDSYNNLGVAGSSASTLTVEGLQQILTQLQGLADQIKAGTSDFDLLGNTDLTNLDTAIQGAISRTQALQDAAKAAEAQFASLAAQTQDALDQAQGNQTAIEDRRHATALANLKDEAAAANLLNSQQYQQAVANENALFELNLKNLKAQADAAAATTKASNDSASTSSGSSSSGSSTGSTPLPSGGTKQPTSTTTITNLQPAPVVNLYASLYGVGNKEMDTLVRYLNDQIIKIQNRSK